MRSIALGRERVQTIHVFDPWLVRFFSVQFRNFKIVYRRYAGLFFCICVDLEDNNLAYLEAIHNFVEVQELGMWWM